MNNTRENFSALADRIKRAAGNIEELRRLERSLDNLFRNGCLTVSEFRRLDDMIVRRLASLTA